MIGLEISVNNSQKCRAGIETGVGVLNSIITWNKKKDATTDTIEIFVGGLNSESETHLDWLKQDLNVGDVVTIKIIDENNFDSPISIRKPEVIDNQVLKSKIKYFYSLREELKDYIDK